MKLRLDETDVKILSILQQDGRMTNADLAKSVGLSAPSALQRVRRLETAGIIKAYAALLDAERLGMKLTVFAMISLSLYQEQPIERFRRSVQSIDEVVECYHCSGEFDFMLKIIVPDIRAYEVLIRERIGKLRGIRQIISSFVLAVPKYTTAIPLPGASE